MPDWRAVRGSEWLGALGLVALTAAELAAGGVRGQAHVLGVTASLLTAAVTAGRCVAAVPAALVGAAATGVALAAHVTHLPDTLLLSLAVLAYALGDRASPAWSRAGAALMSLGTFGAQVAAQDGNFSPPLLFAVIGPWLAGTLVRSRRAIAAQLQATIDDLAAERAAYVELVVERERRYIARELHDIVGHAMSLIVIQARAGRHLAATEPARAAESLQAIADAGRQAHDDVGRLRELFRQDADGAPGLDRAPIVIAQAAAAGLQVRVTGRHATVDLAPEADRTAFRVLQEALTNVVKHAGGAEVEVAFGVCGDCLQLEVANGPGLRAEPLLHGVDPGGRGLPGMAERVQAAGGALDFGPDGGGWRVRATLPCR